MYLSCEIRDTNLNLNYEGDDDGHFEKAYGGPDDKRPNVNMYDIRNTLIDMVDFIFNMFRYMIAFLAFLIVRTFSSSNNITFNKMSTI